MISVVIPAFKRKECVLQLLETVFRQQGAQFEVIVVDDQCPERTGEAVAQSFPQARVLRQEANGGPAVARNRGIRQALGEYVVGLDSDTLLPDQDTFAAVETVFRAYPAVDGLAFHLLTPDGRSEDTMRWWHPVPIASGANRPFLTNYFSGTAYAFRKKAVMEAGLFPELFYMHFEEVDLAYRLMDRGGSILYCPNLRAIHHEHPASKRGLARTYYKPRNQVLMALGIFPAAKIITYLAPRLGYGLCNSALHGYFRAYLRGLASAARLAPARWKERRPVRNDTLRRTASFRRLAAEIPESAGARFPGCRIAGLTDAGQQPRKEPLPFHL